MYASRDTALGIIFLRFFSCALCLVFVLNASNLRADEPNLTTVRGSTGTSVDLNTSLTYADVVAYSLTRVEQLRVTQLDIETAKLGEKDIWYKMFPKLVTVATYSFPLNPQTNETRGFLSLSINSGTYDPIAAFFGRSGAKLAVKGAKMLHVLAVQKYMENLGLAFVTLMALNDTIALQKELVDLAASAVEYTAQRVEQGAASPLELRIVEQRLTLARLEHDKTQRQRQAGLSKFKRQLGIDELQKLSFDFNQSQTQVIGSTEPPVPMGFAQIEAKSLEHKLMATREALQRYNISLAQSEHIPKIGLGIVAPDPLTTQQTAKTYYASVGVTVPIWSWGETLRATERAEIGVNRAISTNRIQNLQLEDEWDELNLTYLEMKERYQIANAQVDIRNLELQRAEISYQSGSKPKQALMEAQLALLVAKLEAVGACNLYHQARVKIRARSGDLLRELIKVDYGDVEKD